MARTGTGNDTAAGRSAAAIFKAIDDKLWKPGGGCSSPLDYMEQSSWLLFLRYLDAREEERKLEARLNGKVYEPALPKRLRWSEWAYPLDAEGKLDYEKMLKGDELLNFVRQQLFPGLKRLRDENPDTNSLQYRIGSIFTEMTCKFTSGYSIREVIDLIQPLRFQTEEDRHELSVLYESRLGEMGNAGRDGGQYYTPRSLIRVMVRVIDPQLGEKVYDGACGSGGFLCEAFAHMRAKARDDARAYRTLQERTFSGGEVKSLAYLTAQMNCILHGLESPRLRFGDTLATKIADFSDRDRVDVIGANPPFGAAVNDATKANFEVQTSETALMFMEYFIAKLKKGGRAAIIIKNTFLSNADNASVAIRKMLLEKCRLRWVLDLPQKVFTAGVHTVVLFFTKDGPTTAPIHYWQLDLKGETLGKKRPLRESDLAPFEEAARGFWRTGWECRREAAEHWTRDPATIDPKTADLSVVNPNVEVERMPTVAECEAEIAHLYAEIGEALKGGGKLEGTRKSLAEVQSNGDAEASGHGWPLVRLGDVCEEIHDRVPVSQIPLSRYVTTDSLVKNLGGRVEAEALPPGGSLVAYRKGDLLLSNIRPYLRKLWLADDDGGCSSDVIVLRPCRKINADYLRLALSQDGFFSYVMRNVSGTKMPRGKRDHIVNFSLPLPPLSVQRSIVARLDAARARCEKVAALARRAAETCGDLRKALLKDAFE